MGGYGVQAAGHFVALPLPIYNPIPPTKKHKFLLRICWPAFYPPTSLKGKWQELKALLLTQSVAASWCVENWEVGFRGGQEWKDKEEGLSEKFPKLSTENGC